MSVVLVTGGTGTLGHAVVPALRARDFEVRVLSRRAESRPDRVRGDLSTGVGLQQALEGVDTVVHLATANGREDVGQTRNLLAAMRQHQQLIAVSIVGCDRIPLPYYRAKLDAEQLITSSHIPWTIQRTTQFHDLIARIFQLQRRLPVLFVPDFAVQPIDVRDVAVRLAELVGEPPTGRAADLGGPEVRAFRDLATAWRSQHATRKRIVPLRFPGKIFAGYRSGENTVPDRALGRITFEEYLRSGSPGAAG